MAEKVTDQTTAERATVPAITFFADEIPETTVERKSEPNPFDGIVDDLNKNRDKAASFYIPKGDEKVAAKFRRFARDCGLKNNVTLRLKYTDGVGEHKAETKVTVWAVDRITRKRDAK